MYALEPKRRWKYHQPSLGLAQLRLDGDLDFGLLDRDVDFSLLSCSARSSSVSANFVKRASVADRPWSVDTRATFAKVDRS